VIAREREEFARRHPRSRELHDRAARSLLAGVPMSWMTMWAGGHPIVERMSALRERFVAGAEAALERHSMPWSVVSLGARAEHRFAAEPPAHRRGVRAATDRDVEEYLHLYLLNRGVLITPFHNMALMCPATIEEQVDRHTEAFTAAVEELAP
jgi:glutamate-1-semialdehyde aminotransferase